MKRTMLYAALGLLVLGLPHVVSASPAVTLLVDGKRLPTSPAPVLRGGRVYVPVTVFRPIGLYVRQKNAREAEVAWPDTDSFTDFKAGVRRYVDDMDPERSTYLLPGTPFMSDRVLMVPLTAVLDGRYDPDTRTVSIRRDRGWLRYRLEDDDAYVKNQPQFYSHLFLGDYVPVIPKWEIERAGKLDASGDWRGAVRILRRLIESRPFKWDTRLVLAVDEWKAYEPLGRILTREQPKQAEGYITLGTSMALDEEYGRAEDAFRHAAEIDPSRADAHFASGWAVLRQEKVESAFDRKPETLRKALAEYDKALEADPTCEPALRASGYAWLALAYVENQRGGYTDQSKAQVLPYLKNAVDRFERLLRAAGPSPQMSDLVQHIRDQLD